MLRSFGWCELGTIAWALRCSDSTSSEDIRPPGNGDPTTEWVDCHALVMAQPVSVAVDRVAVENLVADTVKTATVEPERVDRLIEPDEPAVCCHPDQDL